MLTRQHKGTNLQGVGKELVHLGDLGGDGEVDGPVANLNDEASENLGVDLCLLTSQSATGKSPMGSLTSLVTFSFLPWPT